MAYRYGLIKIKGHGTRNLSLRRIPGTSRLEKATAVISCATHTHAISISLDELSSKLLLRVSRTWRVPERQALRRVLHPAITSPGSQQKLSQLQAFHELQRRLNLTPARANEWQDAVRESRR
jgi:hypothetical protein